MDSVLLLGLFVCNAVLIHSQSSVLKTESGEVRHTVELLAVMDKRAFDAWYERTPGEEGDRRNRTVSRVADFLSSLVIGINDLYESVQQYGLSLDVRLKKLHLLNSDLWSSEELMGSDIAVDIPQISTDRALRLFYVWAWKARQSLGSFDHAVLLTGYDLVNPEAPKKLTQGVAYKGVMCRYGSVSVVENNFTHQVIDTVAHELGHSLGCDHDEETSCQNSEGHVMSIRTEVNSTNRWSFSPCSAGAIKSYIGSLDRLKANCLLKTSTAPTPGVELGALMDPDQQCTMLLGRDAFFCREFYPSLEAYEELCTSMWCSANPDHTHCLNYLSSEGFDCGHDKVCKRGNCTALQTSLASATPDAVAGLPECPHGDQPGVVHSNLTCDHLSHTQPWRCYSNVFSAKCCLACSSVMQNVSDCEFGDKAEWCGSQMNYPFDCYLNEQTCCHSCAQHRKQGEDPGCRYGDRSQECQGKLAVPLGCYQNEELCCETCGKAKDVDHHDCPYGDRSSWCQTSMQVPNGCYLNQDLCCGTCGRLANSTTGSRVNSTAVDEKDSLNSTSVGVPGCLYGDRYPEWCQKETPYVCYNRTHRQWCCQSCAQQEQTEQPGCEYGNKHSSCEDLVYPYACYNEDNARLCCHLCGLYHNDTRPDCPYGDHEAWCYKLGDKYTNDQWCHLDAENGHCCGTCLYDETAIPVLGSRVKKLGLPRPK